MTARRPLQPIADGRLLTADEGVQALICERDDNNDPTDTAARARRLDVIFYVKREAVDSMHAMTEVGKIVCLPATLRVHDMLAARELGHVVAMRVEERLFGFDDETDVPNHTSCRVIGTEVQGGDPSDYRRDRELGPGRYARRGRLVPNVSRKPSPPRDGAWARRLEEIRAERTERAERQLANDAQHEREDGRPTW